MPLQQLLSPAEKVVPAAAQFYSAQGECRDLWLVSLFCPLKKMTTTRSSAGAVLSPTLLMINTQRSKPSYPWRASHVTGLLEGKSAKQGPCSFRGALPSKP